MKSYFFISCVLALLFFSCSKTIENENLSSVLKEIPEDSLFSIKDFNTASWDTMYVSKPYNYSHLKRKKIILPLDIDEKFEKISNQNDGWCILIFVKNNTLVNYSVIPRTSTADFAFVDSLNQGLSSTTQFKIISDSVFSRKVIAFVTHS